MERWPKHAGSGEALCIIGDLLLKRIDPQRTLLPMKETSTVFQGQGRVVIARGTSDSSRLKDGYQFLTSIRADQHHKWLRHAAHLPGRLEYLFFSASAKDRTLRFWQVPEDIVKKELVRLKEHGPGGEIKLKIAPRGKKSIVGDQDITKYAGHPILIPPAKRSRYKKALEAQRANPRHRKVNGCSR